MSENLFFSSPLMEHDLRQRLKARLDEESDFRTAYFRDATAIIHSYPFRRLKHKTQVFFSPKNDHISTRIEHVMHVASISAAVCRALGLNSDLAWAIGLGHDLGHAPFGHAGEYILEELTKKSFSHECYGLRVVDFLANRGAGLNLCYAVRDGIVNHCGERFEQSIQPDFQLKELSQLAPRSSYPATWEACVMRMSDKMAYLGRDFEDAISLKIITKNDLPNSIRKVLGDTNSEIIDKLTNDLIKTSLKTGKIGFSDDIFEKFTIFKNFNYDYIYKSTMLEQWQRHIRRLLSLLYDYLFEIYFKYRDDIEGYKKENNKLADGFSGYLITMYQFYTIEGGFDRAPFDYIAGMTDDFAISCINNLLVPSRVEISFAPNLFDAH